jgi:glycosyltransferase involved in cell wall biosynthesis
MRLSKKNRLRVFHGIVNYGTQAGLFAQGLREEGIDALSVSYPDPFQRKIDVELFDSEGNIFVRIIKKTLNQIRMFYWFFRYNTFHFYFGTTLSPKQWDLFFYRIFNKKIIMEYLGYDVQLYQYSLERYEITNVRYYKTHDDSVLYDRRKTTRLKFESRYIDKQLVCAPYLSEFVPGSEVLPLAIDLRDYEYSPKEMTDDEIVIMHAPTNRGNKGTSFILEAIDRLLKDGYNIRIHLVENITHDELKMKYLECDIFVDQILGGWYGTAAIEAMAIGRPTVCFLRESYFDFIDYGESIPIINAQPSNIYEVLKETLEERHHLPRLGEKSRIFVENVHDINKIIKRVIEIYKNL